MTSHEPHGITQHGTRLAALGLGDVLLRMFTRMSWDAPAFSGHNPLEHIHGPDCTCNPESALRVQVQCSSSESRSSGSDSSNTVMKHYLYSETLLIVAIQSVSQ